MRYMRFLLICLLLTSCTSGRKHLERAALYEREGMLQEAYYGYAALYGKKPRSVEAHVGMKRTAQGLLDRLLQEASFHYLKHDLTLGDRYKVKAEDHRAGMERQGLRLEWDPTLEERRRTACVHLAGICFGEAQEAFRQGRFKDAEETCGRCLSLDPEHRDALHLKKLAQLEPKYLQANKAMELGLWRDAFTLYASITDKDPAYKDSWQWLEECRNKASYTLAYVPGSGTGRTISVDQLFGGNGLELQLAANMKRALLDLEDPLMILIDRENQDGLLAEQMRGLSGLYDERHAAEAGRLLGASHVLTARILKFDDVLGRNAEIQFQLIEVATGRIHIADVVRVNKQEIAKGNTRIQLLEKASERVAERLKGFDRHAR